MLDAGLMIAGLVCFFIKVSTLLLFLHIFSVKSGLRILIWLGIVVQFLGYGAFTGIAIGVLIKCTTPETASTLKFCKASWEVTRPGAFFSVTTDFYTILLPVHAIWKMNLSPGRKLGVFLIFMTGLLSVQTHEFPVWVTIC